MTPSEDPVPPGELAKNILDRLAETPRFAGSSSEGAARAYCAELLAEAGFDVVEERFSFSGFAAQAGPSLLGVMFAVVAIVAGCLSAAGSVVAAFTVAVAGAVLVAIAGRILLRWGTLHFPAMRRSSTNLVATRAGLRPSVWLVAHIDSKSQTVRMLVRVGSVILSGLFFVALGLTLALSIPPLPVTMGIPENLLVAQALITAALAAVSTIPVIFCFVTNRSRGALDNASGVAAVLLAAQQVRRSVNVGILITSAEELALAGARAFALAHADRGVAINCDTIDDDGRFICMVAGGKRQAGGSVRDCAAAIGEEVRVRGMIRGILADNVAFSDAGWDSCTLSRGNLGTLARVHTSGDVPGRLDGTGIARAAGILVATVEELT